MQSELGASPKQAPSEPPYGLLPPDADNNDFEQLDDLGDLEADALPFDTELDGEDAIKDVSTLVASLLRSREQQLSRPQSRAKPSGSSSGADQPQQRTAAATTTTSSQRRPSNGTVPEREQDVPLWEGTQHNPSVADDFIRNFLVRARMHRSLDAFNNEWYELKARGALPSSDELALPDVYAQNEALHDELDQLRVEVAHAQEVAAKAQSTWDRFRKERDVHRLHHKRVLNEKHALVVDLRRLRAHYDTLTPLVGELRAKTEAALREKALARLDRDRALARLAAAEAQLKAAGVVSAAAGDGGSSAIAAAEGLNRGMSGVSSSNSVVLAGRLAAVAAGATGSHWQLRQAPSYGGHSSSGSAGEASNSASSSASSSLVGNGGATLNPQQRLADGGDGPAGAAINRSVRRAAAQAAALAAESRLPADDQVNPYLGLSFEPAHADRYTRTPARSWAAHGAPIAGLAFHPTKPVIVTASDDRTWRLWAVRMPTAATVSEYASGSSERRESLGSRGSERSGRFTAVGAAHASREETLGLNTDGDTASVYTRDRGDVSGGGGAGAAGAPLGRESPGGFGRSASASQQQQGYNRQHPTQSQRQQQLDIDGDAELVMSGSGHRSWLSDAAFNPAGSVLATACGDGVVKLWSLSTSKCTHNLTEHSAAAWALAWNSAGDFLATASMDHCARVWDAVTGKPRAALRGHVDSVNAVTWQPFSPNVITGSADKTVSIWDVRSGQCVQTFFGHTNAVNDVAVTLGGDVIASCDAEGWVRCWDLRMVCQWAEGHVNPSGPVNGLSFDRSGSVLAAACEDGLVRVLGLPIGPTAAVAGAALAGVYARGLSGATQMQQQGGGGGGLNNNSSNSRGMPSLSLLASLGGHSGAVQAVAFDPTSSYLASAGDDGTVRLWAEPA